MDILKRVYVWCKQINEINELVEQIIKKNSDKSKTGKKRNNKRSEMENDEKDLKEDVINDSKEKME